MTTPHDARPVARYHLFTGERTDDYGCECRHGFVEESPSGDFVLFTDYDALRSEVERLREDANRMNWLTRAGDIHIGMIIDAPGDGDISISHDLPPYRACGITLREAVDSAIKLERDSRAALNAQGDEGNG
ncbi:hypothetical protein [Lysobacter enzymogenes]|uniref:hypothetical protein n=1 Tax=Lysobacter enzymogenes TaxID=69 RepID=UPI001A963925|nr:hypothetical protein [Lysobacter enzymogenes]QQP96465.1 hypothetical protein JHW38_25265 [Lysobacter enzymogenes]QQP96499.1 hypothetical protein JHW38_00115 [Lysobacter enzymogenes]